ncbi:MAG: hypothetical protein PHQ94_09140 [Syntrophomonas sp.]|jgi:hypothetical protein|nr:hypothetical protein [Syntrophomonas sp.]
MSYKICLFHVGGTTSASWEWAIRPTTKVEVQFGLMTANEAKEVSSVCDKMWDGANIEGGIYSFGKAAANPQTYQSVRRGFQAVNKSNLRADLYGGLLTANGMY